MHTVVHPTQWQLFLFSNRNREQYICHINGQISYTWNLFNLNNTVLCRVAVIWIESWLSSHPPEFWFLQKPDCVVKYNRDKDNHPHIIEIFKGGPYAHYWYFLPFWHASYFCWLFDYWEEQIQRLPSGLPHYDSSSHRPRTQCQNDISGA